MLTEAGEARVQAILARMTVEQKVGQIIQADIASVTPEDVRRYRLGSVLNGGKFGAGRRRSGSGGRNGSELADAFYDASMDVAVGEPAIPIVWGTDAVHGHSNIIGATIFPHNVGLGATRDPELIERIGQVTRGRDPGHRAGMDFRAYRGPSRRIIAGDGPTKAIPPILRWSPAYVGSMIRGLQGPPSTSPILAGPHVAASTKHYLADGGTTDGRDQGDAAISELALRLIHGAPYIPAIEKRRRHDHDQLLELERGQAVRTSRAGDRRAQGRMNFDGMVITDWNAHGQVAGCSNASCPRAVDAGIDMFMAPDSWRMFYDSTLAQVRDGTIAMDRLDDAVARVLRLKERLGLFEMGKPVRSARCRASIICSGRPITARSRARRCASRWCCSRTPACCPCSRAAAS